MTKGQQKITKPEAKVASSSSPASQPHVLASLGPAEHCSDGFPRPFPPGTACAVPPRPDPAPSAPPLPVSIHPTSSSPHTAVPPRCSHCVGPSSPPLLRLDSMSPRVRQAPWLPACSVKTQSLLDSSPVPTSQILSSEAHFTFRTTNILLR